MTDLAKRDSKLLRIKEEIKKRDQFLLKKTAELEEKCKSNEYLEHVKNDYVSYSNEVKHEKQKQLGALNVINQYLDNLIKTNQLTGEQLRTAKHELNDVLKEINKISND
jgi:predicted RND superfamily exporter protein